jgi:hypothetical protein
MLEELDELLVGLSLWEAEEAAKDLGFFIRVAIDNGVDLGAGCGNPRRLNIEMKEHKIARVVKIG